jgi:hypothetical protein
MIEVTDVVYSTASAAPVGTVRQLDYPLGNAHRARIRRPFLRAACYLALLALLTLLVLRLMNWIS